MTTVPGGGNATYNVIVPMRLKDSGSLSFRLIDEFLLKHRLCVDLTNATIDLYLQAGDGPPFQVSQR